MEAGRAGAEGENAGMMLEGCISAQAGIHLVGVAPAGTWERAQAKGYMSF